MKKLTIKQQLTRLPKLGHGWYDEVLHNGNHNLAVEEAEHIDSHHIVIFSEGDGTYRIWHSEVSSNDPHDRNGNIARWYDYAILQDKS